jgi:hypothetical protein
MRRSRQAPAKRRIVMTTQVHAECLRLDGAGQKTSDRRIAMAILVAQIFLQSLYYYVYIYSKTPYNNSHDDMTFSSSASPSAPCRPTIRQLFSTIRKKLLDVIHKSAQR